MWLTWHACFLDKTGFLICLTFLGAEVGAEAGAGALVLVLGGIQEPMIAME